MTELIGGLNAASPSWWSWVVHAGWQAAVVGLVVLAAVTLGRRWPSPIRYWILVLALVKFAVPPTAGLPIGVFSRVGPTRVATTVPGSRLPLKLDGPTRAPEVVSSSAGGMRIDDEDFATRAGHAPTDREAAVRDAPRPAETTQARRAVPPAGALRWTAWLMLVQLAGGAVLAASVATQWIRLVRLRCKAEEVTEGPLHERFESLCRRMGVRRVPRLLVAPRGDCPFSFGLLCPAVVVPHRLLDRISPEHLETALAHEIAHHRRGDLWINGLQAGICIVWWFHPIVWLVGRVLRKTREECCDDLLLARRIVTPAGYCDALLRVAAQRARPVRPQLALSMADHPHPLRRRFLRIMDAELRRSARLSWPGSLAILVLALLLLPGLRTHAEPTEGNLAAQSDRGGPQAVSISARPAAGEETTAPASGDSAAQIIVAGRVLDEAGNPIAGADVWYPRTWGRTAYEFVTMHTRSDEAGRFRITFPAKWVTQEPRERVLSTLWGYAAGRRIGRGQAYRALFSQEEPGKIEIVLGPETDTSFVVYGPDGRPLAGARVEPRHFYLRPTNFFPFPPAVSRQVGAETDQDGRVSLPAIPFGKLNSLRVTSQAFGTQNVYIGSSEANATDYPIRLRPAGRVLGRLVADQPEVTRGVSVFLRTEAPRETREVFESLGRADATVVTDDQGKFTVDAIAAGLLRLSVQSDESLPLRFLLPDPVTVNAEETTRVLIEAVPAVQAEGVVRVKGTGEPLAGVEVWVQYGSPRQSNFVVSDTQGRFSTYVLPGRVSVSSIDAPGQHMRPRLPWHFVQVPEVDYFELPPVELVPYQKFSGRLVDQQGDPVPNATLRATLHAEDAGLGATDEDGNLALTRVPMNVDLDQLKFSVGRTRVPVIRTEIIQKDPLVLQATFSLTPKAGTVIRGTVVDQRGHPVAYMRVHVAGRRSADRSAGDADRSVYSPLIIRTDALGRFRAPQLVDRGITYRIEVSSTGQGRNYEKISGQSGWIEATGEITSFEKVTVRRQWSLRGTVRNEQGEPVARATVRYRRDKGRETLTATTGGNGRFAFRRVFDLGELHLSVTAPGYLDFDGVAEIRDEIDTEDGGVELVLRPQR